MIWLFCTILSQFLFWCELFNFFFGGIVCSSSVRPFENKILCADHPMLNRKPSSTEMHTQTINLGSNHSTVCPWTRWQNTTLPILTFGPIEIKAIYLSCGHVLAVCIIIMLLIFDILPTGPFQRSSSFS